MDPILRRLTEPGSASWAAFALRVLLGAVFLQAGLGKFVNHDEYVERFDRWGVGAAPGAMAILVGALEVAAALALILGVVPRLAAIAMIGNMVGALVTAGRVDGGSNIWLPIVLIVLLAVLVAVGSRRLALLPAVPPALLPGGRRD